LIEKKKNLRGFYIKKRHITQKQKKKKK